jgi:5-deoxy-glucuronate isomerase
MSTGAGSTWFHRRGALAAGGWQSIVDERTPGWEHTGIRVAEIADDESRGLATVPRGRSSSSSSRSPDRSR